MTSIDSRPKRLTYRVLAVCCALGLFVAAGLWWTLRDTGETTLAAYYPKTVGLYPGSEVRVLGVAVGTVDTVQPQGDQVRVSMTVESDVDVPANASAVITSPSLVSDRYVQLTPVYMGGPKLGSGTVLAQDHTATPVELDDLTRSANDLTTALGPDGANSDGALSRMLDTGAKNLNGNGSTINDTVKQLSSATKTLSNSQGDLFSTVDNLNKFTGTLAQSDDQVHAFGTKLAEVSQFLAGERQNLGGAVNGLATALGDVDQFISSNRELVKSNVDKLADISKVLVDQRGALAEILDVAPQGVSGLVNSYNASSGSFDVRPQLNELDRSPALMACKLLKQSAPRQVPQALSDLCGQLAPLVDGAAKLPKPSDVVGSVQQGKVPGLPLPLVDPGGGR